MHVPGAALPRSRPGWLGPAAAGIALVAAAFIAASYLAPSPKSDPMAGTIAKLEDQVRADPESADLRIEVADAYMSANRPQEALAQYQEALRIDGSREEAIYGEALAYRQLGDLNSAGAQLQSIIQLNESNPMAALNKRLQGAHFYLGLILREQGRNDDAINEFRAALSLNRSDADTLFELGKTFALAGQNDDAASAFDITLAFVPEFEEAYVETEKLATAMGDTTKAAFAGAMLDVIHGKAKDAVPALRGIAEGANTARYWWGLGYALEKTKDNAGAVAAYQKAVEINPGELLAAESLRRLQETGSP